MVLDFGETGMHKKEKILVLMDLYSRGGRQKKKMKKISGTE